MSDVLAEFEVRGAPLRVRRYAPDDEAGCVACYNSIFPVDDPSVPAIDARTWRWKYDPRPTGRTEIVVATHPEVGIVGAYPSQPLRATDAGRTFRTAQITDLMVRHDWRRVGPRPGLFVTLGLRYYAEFCGDGPDRQEFNYGWPVPAWRMGQRYLRYENVRDWNFLAREIPVDFAALRKAPSGLEVRDVVAFAGDADALFWRLAPGLGLSLVKDSAYLNWRYATHPSRRYGMLECRAPDGTLRGIAVDTIADFRRPNTAFVLELLVDAGDLDAMVALLAACERRARIAETGAIAGIWNPVDPRFRALQQLGYMVWDSGYFLVAATFSIETRTVRERYWFTMGDSDLV